MDIYGTKIISGYSNKGQPIIVKILRGTDTQLHHEISAIKTLLPPPVGLSLVHGELMSVKLKETDDASANSGSFSCLVMPHYSTTLSRLPRLPPKAVLRGGKDIKRALQYIHSKNMVHMDVKPDNIFLDMNGSWYLGDFGSCVINGGKIREFTRFFLSSNFTGKKAYPGLDFYMLAVTLVLVLVKDPLKLEANHISMVDHQTLLSVVHQIEDQKLKNFILDLVRESSCESTRFEALI